jgi:tripartite-type tricarboxylate transporter receptor subunit TctC
MRRLVAVALALSALCMIAAPLAHAQKFPERPIRFIVPFPPGGGNDILARVIAPKMAEFLGQPVIVDNRAGAGGNIGAEIVAKSAPDGYTILIASNQVTMNPALYSKLPFDIARDFAPITQVVDVWFILIAHPSMPVKTVKELIAMAKSRPGQINYSSSGSGGGPHLAVELFNSMAGTRMTHIPYKGSGPSFTDLLAGQVQLTFDSMVQGLQYVKTGRLRAIAVLGGKRSMLLPEDRKSVV